MAAGAPPPRLDCPAPSGAGRLEPVAHRPWPGAAVAVDPASAHVVVALPGRLVVGSLPDLGDGRSVDLADVRAVAPVPGLRAVCAAGGRGARVLALDRSAPLLRLRTPGRVQPAVSPGGARLALVGQVARPRASVGVWDLAGGRRLWTAPVYAAACAAWADGAVLAVGGRDLRLFGHEGSVLPVAPAPRGERITALAAGGGVLVSAGEGPVGTVWDADRAAVCGSVPVPAGPGRSLAVDGPTLAAGTRAAGEAVALVDLRRRTVDHLLRGVSAVALAGPWLVVTGREGTAVLAWRPDA
jgi:hypothetical protein